MKIAATSNFDEDTFCEYFVAENVNVYWANQVINAFHKTMPEDSPVYYRVVDDNYELQTWEP